ncbi:hypothetical protein [Flavobacterium sp.]|uniref:hypothetical protein n=1 Tax=Flavobacterium sp. TaxID=239 RepID=UPI0025C4915A|nr:hypothetical protein [Flavobacterium sp.]
MRINQFMNENLRGVNDVITSLPNNRFDSHEFIKAFAKKFEIQYVSFLQLYKVKPHRIVHSLIARDLTKNMVLLKISNEGKVMSETIFGLMNPNQMWNKKVKGKLCSKPSVDESL